MKLETSCRLNYATTKAKLNEFNVVMDQAHEILRGGENGKAYYRLGQAYHHFKKYDRSLKNLEKAVKMLPDDVIG